MAKKNERRFRRIALNLPAQIVINAVDSYEGRLVNMSPGDMALIANTRATAGDAVVVSLTGLDVIEGTIARTMPDGFAVSFLLSKKRRALLTERLMLLANASFSEGLADRRGSLRHHASNARTSTRLSDGTSLFVRIIDMSVDGASVEAPRRPPVGTEIHIGRQRGIIVRHTPRGFVVAYEASPAQAAPILRAV